MGLVILIVIAGLLTAFYCILPKKIKRRENAFLFMIVLNINISVSWIIIEELKWLIISRNTTEYIAFLFYRSLLIPLLVLTFLSLYLAVHSLFIKGLTIIVYTVTFITLENLVIFYKVYQLAKWEISYSVLYYLILLVIARMVLLWYQNTFYRKAEGIQ